MIRRVVHTADTCGGAPRLDGTRLTCANVIVLLADIGLDEFMRVHDYLSTADVLCCLEYCAARQCTEEKTLRNFCEGCVLDVRPEEPPAQFIGDILEYDHESRKPGYAFLGTPDDYAR